jgi:molybdate/tungstate transport system permease protein
MAGAIMSWARAISEFGAIVIIAYYPMVASVLIYDRFLSKGLIASRPIAILLLLICLLIFIALKLLVKKK